MPADPHRPIWLDGAELPGFPRLDRDLDLDVAIIGGGITGLTLALLLRREGRAVGVFERSRVARGATANTSGHLTTCLDLTLASLVSRFGMDGARLVMQECARAIDDIGTLGVETEAGSGFHRVAGFRFTEHAEEIDGLAQEAELATRLGLAVSLVTDTPLPFAKAALRFEDQAIVQPLRHASALARAAAAGGALLFENTPVLDVEAGTPCRVQTESHTVRARCVVHATHTPLGRTVSVQARLGPFTSYVLCARLASMAPAALCWDTADPYFYYRPMDVSSYRLIVGGCDHKTGQAEPGSDPFEKLEAHVRARFPVLSIERRWSAEVFEPADGLPFVGRLGDEPIYVATGFAGTGLTFGTLSARLLCAEIAGRHEPLAELLSPRRIKPLAAGPEVVRENANAAWRLVRDRLARPEAGRTADVPRGEGRLVDVDGHRAAVYRGPDGALHVMSPVCTHLGCIVHWNAAAATWDCPCHGGRYLPTGDVLSGPPTQGLQQRSQSANA